LTFKSPGYWVVDTSDSIIKVSYVVYILEKYSDLVPTRPLVTIILYLLFCYDSTIVIYYIW